MRNSITERSVSVGAVTLEITHEADYDGDASWIGQFSEYRAPANVNEKLVHRATGSVLDHHGIWRDERGRIVSTPEWRGRGAREYEFTFHDNGHDALMYAIQDWRRMEGRERGDWCFLGIVASVTVDGAVIATSSLWGMESDDRSGYLESTGREQAREALREARAWLGRRGTRVAVAA